MIFQSVTSTSVSEASLDSVSATVDSSTVSSSVVFTTADHYHTSDTTLTHHVLGPPSITTTAFSNASGPPPLIPATSLFHASNSNSTYRSFATTTLFAPRNPYEPQLSTQATRFPSTALATHMTPPVLNHQQFASTHLPKLILPTFSGDPLDWITFWDSFYVTIPVNPNLSGIQNFSYLKAQLKGEAARTIAGLPLTEANYTSSIALLEDHYGQRHKIVDVHMRAIRDMAPPSNSLNNLHVFYDSVESHIRGLAS